MPGLDDPVVALSIIGGYWVMPITYTYMPHDPEDPLLRDDGPSGGSLLTADEQEIWATIEHYHTKGRQLHGCGQPGTTIRQREGRRY